MKKPLEYIIRKGSLEQFEKDITYYHLVRIRGRRNQENSEADGLKQEMMEKYGLSEGDYAHNYFAHFDKICRRRNANYGN